MTSTAQHITAPIKRTLEEEVADFSRSMPKKKEEAFDALRHLVARIEAEGMAAATSNREPLSDVAVDLAKLWAHFLPPTPKKARTAFDWCATAIAKNDTRRYYLNHVYVTDEHIVGTDGHSLHVAPNTEGLPAGYYGREGVRLHDLDYATFPDWQRLFPDPNDAERKWVTFCLCDPKTGTTKHGDKTIHYYELPVADDKSEHKVHIDAKLRNRLVSMDPKETIDVQVGTMSDLVQVKLSGSRRAVVMPLRQ